MLTDEEETILHLASLRGTTTEMTFARDELKTAVESIIAVRVRAARAQELRNLAAEMQTSERTSRLVSKFELLDRANHIESSPNG